MMRPVDQETYHWIVCYSQLPKGEGTLSHAGAHGGAPGSIKRQKEQEENIGKSHYCGFPRKEWMRQGKHI